jgi:hypothetical protein
VAIWVPDEVVTRDGYAWMGYCGSWTRGEQIPLPGTTRIEEQPWSKVKGSYRR